MKYKNVDKEFFYLMSQEEKLKKSMGKLILTVLKANNGRITFVPDNEDDEYPVSATLWGKHDNPIIDITDVYLAGKDRLSVYADGIEQSTGCMETGFEIYPEQYLGILQFFYAVLNWKRAGNETDEEEQPETGPFEVTVLFGSEAVMKYNETGVIPSDDWINEHGGLADVKSFKTQEELNAYIEGLNDFDGWSEYLVLDDFMKNLLKENRKINS
jgi:hypothetical protein